MHLQMLFYAQKKKEFVKNLLSIYVFEIWTGSRSTNKTCNDNIYIDLSYLNSFIYPLFCIFMTVIRFLLRKKEERNIDDNNNHDKLNKVIGEKKLLFSKILISHCLCDS